MALLPDAVERVRRRQVVLGEVVFGLRHGEGKEIVRGRFRDFLHVIKELLLHALVFQRFDSALPLERIVSYQALRVSQPYRDTGELCRAVRPEAAHIGKVRFQVEGTTGQVEVLTHAQSAISIERLLRAVYVEVGPRIVTLRYITVILCRGQVQRQAGQAVRLVRPVFPIAGEIHVLRTERLQGAVVGKGDRTLQVEHKALLRMQPLQAGAGEKQPRKQAVMDETGWMGHGYHLYYIRVVNVTNKRHGCAR